MSIETIRNIGIIAHIDAGKTSLTERILFYTKKIDYMGEVHHGTATMDYLPEEQEHGITITASCTTCAWKEHSLNIIDTPGHVDFSIEVERSLRVLDGAIAVFCAVSGVQSQSETVWRQSEQFKVPKLIFINKIDRPHADFNKVLEEISIRLKVNACPITLPYTDEEGRPTILHLLEEKKLFFLEEEQGREIKALPLTAQEEVFLKEEKEKLLTKIAESDVLFFEQYLSESYDENDVLLALRRLVLSRELIPVYAGSALENRGVQPLLDAVNLFLPNPKEKKIQAHNPNTGVLLSVEAQDEKLCALAFKVLMQEEKISFLRLYSGSLAKGERIYNVNTKQYDIVQNLFRVHTDEQEEIDKAFAGEIVGVLGLDSRTGDTYTLGNEVLLEKIHIFQPVISIALEARNNEENPFLHKALMHYVEEDPTLHIEHNEITGQCLLSGMGELHLDIIVEKLQREHKIKPRKGRPQVIYKEVPTKQAEVRSIFEREIEGRMHYCELSLTLSPHKNLNTIRFTFDTSSLEKEVVETIEKTIENTFLSSPRGHSLENILVEINNISPHRDISPLALQMALNTALQEALIKVELKTIEPIMSLEIDTPEEHLGKSLLALGQKKAKVENLIELSEIKKIQAKAPLAELFGFATDLRSITQGKANLLMHFHSFGKM